MNPFVLIVMCLTGTYVLIMAWVARVSMQPVAPLTPTQKPRVSILVAARNEEDALPPSVSSAMVIRGGPSSPSRST